jgi:thiol-disulfide isomerase/thioredoxin
VCYEIGVTTANERPLSVPPGVLALVALMIAGFAILPRVFKPHDGELSGKLAPDFSLRVLLNAQNAGAAGTDGTLSLSELKGNAVVLDFWASWCGFCGAEAPIVNKLAERYRDRGLVVVGVDTGDSEQKGRAWAAQHMLSFPIVFDANDGTARAYDVNQLPTLVVVSREGKVLAVRTGMTEEAELESLVKQAL